MSHYEKAWQAVAERIERAVQAAGRTAGSVRLLAVSKTFPVDAVRAVHAVGQRSFGENHVQEGAAKRQATTDLADVVWHLIGPLQGNKTRLAAETFDLVESVDRLKIAQRLSAQRPADRAPLDVCVQVNVSGEASKGGFTPEEADAAVAEARKSLEVVGLMTMAPEGADARPHFRRLREAAARSGLEKLSMGMTQDFEAAVEEGATHVRVGTAIFEGVVV